MLEDSSAGFGFGLLSANLRLNSMLNVLIDILRRHEALPSEQVQSALGQLASEAVSAELKAEFLTALAEGQQYKEIADTLGISINTVRKNIKSVYLKLHVNTRLEAVRKLGRA